MYLVPSSGDGNDVRASGEWFKRDCYSDSRGNDVIILWQIPIIEI